MKPAIVALALGAAPTAAFAQGFSCGGCDHVASYFRGVGGFIGAVAEGEERVTFVVTCGNVTISGDARVAGGTASLLFDHRNGLACDQEGGGLEVANLKDGGWFWITDAENSAVGNLVARDLFDDEGMPKGDAVALTDAGEGVTMTHGKGAVYLRETATGRVGILPNLLPEPPAAEATPPVRCGFHAPASAGAVATRKLTNCMLGDGGTQVLATSMNDITGATVRIVDGATVERPAGGGAVTIVADLWSNGTGHITTDTANDARRGNPRALGSNFSSRDHRLTGVTYELSVESEGPGGGQDVESGTAVAGVDFTEAGNVATITVGPDGAYCGANANSPATVTVTALMADASSANQLTPPVSRNAATGAVGSTKFTVACPAASASMGQEPVPENPFPTGE